MTASEMYAKAAAAKFIEDNHLQLWWSPPSRQTRYICLSGPRGMVVDSTDRCTTFEAAVTLYRQRITTI